MTNSWDNLIMSLSHATQLTIDPMVASLLSKKLKRKSLESSNPISSSQTLMMEERRGKSRGKSITWRDKNRDKSKSRRNLTCYYCDKDKLGHMRKDYWKLEKDKGKDNNDRDDHNANVAQDKLIIMDDYGKEFLIVKYNSS